ncbi:MAG: TrkH family potassium uptake protein [candidate division KSB1 bacterium]|nr:TrkH family potassium uptake protein [candidate division KSB1 bacterium]MDZ7275858.1 TrkH family potassium uptake protein [candidate division KSB1 bacterium]MDZ7287608.1 TrkH family potassium uptake protein [candidate division KSB1 bacterium]MDZ7306488.1 TrkH family potassium uptake protein [candidate division KSB1 bacterium]MDZ7350586.1 TrkH family potassium uptake protein [candidate division KSB1 bacterium]
MNSSPSVWQREFLRLSQQLPSEWLLRWRSWQRRLGPARILVASFAGLILVGAFLLTLPAASTGESPGFVDALFTATSATCVTGLTVVDTGTTFSRFGQIVILVLIQLGGLGLMTFSTLLLYLLGGGRLSLSSRDLLQETFSQGPVQNLKALLKTIFLATFTIELVGAMLLTLRFMRDLPSSTAVYHGIFHAISAFCNAGFALYSDNLEKYRGDLLVNVTITSLIIIGGLGFVVIFEINRRLRNDSRTPSLHVRLVLRTTAWLIACGAAAILLLEMNNTMAGLPWETRLLTSYFQSVTARTAGFNTLNIGSLSDATLFILIILMFIGASPGSCGGGIKTTTAAVLLALIRSRFGNEENVHLLYRRIPNDVLARAISVVFFASVLIALFTFLLLLSETGGMGHQQTRGLFLELFFETTSAFGTVGLSTGITPKLTPFGRILIIMVMFIGRLGPLTVALAVGPQAKTRFTYARENVLVG